MIKTSPLLVLFPLVGRDSNWGDVFIRDWDDWDDWVDAETELEAVILPPTLPSQLPLGVTVFANGVMLQEGEDYIVEDGSVILNSPSEDVSITFTYLETGGIMHSQIAI